MKDTLIMIGVYALIHAAFGAWTEKTDAGGKLTNFLHTWRADGWVHGIMVSVSVYILGCCAILAIALAQIYLQRF